MKKKGIFTTENTENAEVDAVASVRSVVNTEDLPDGFQMTELGPLPEEWRMVRLEDVVTRAFGGGTPSTSNPDFWGGTIPWTTSAVIQNDDVELCAFQRRITEEGLRNSSTSLAPKGSLLVGTRVGVGKAAVATFDVAISQDLTALILDQHVDAYFVAYLLKSRWYQSWFENNKRGATIKGVPRQDLLKLPIPLPPLPEQRAIAHVLRTVQRAKEATEGVIAALKELKKSLMQHLFTYGPVPVGAKNFSPQRESEIGPIPAHWRVVRLGEVAEFGQNRTMQKPKASLIPFMPMSLLPEDTIYISQWEMRRDKEIRSGIPIQNGDFLLAKITPSFENGKQGIVKDIPGGWGYASTEVIPIRPYPELHTEYLAFYLKQPSIRQELAGKMEGSTGRQRLPKMAVQQLLIPLPPLDEQREIARMLQAVDAKIAAEQARRAALEELFKSLLHLLMTGKVRVKEDLGSQNANS
jgi:type I restriction enzyme S subunit